MVTTRKYCRAVQKPHQVVCIINSSVSQLVKYIATYSCEIKIPFHLNYTGVRRHTQSYWSNIGSSVCIKCLSCFFHRVTPLKTVQGAGWFGTNKIKIILCSFSKRNPDERLFAKKLRLLRSLLHFLDNLKGKSCFKTTWTDAKVPYQSVFTWIRGWWEIIKGYQQFHKMVHPQIIYDYSHKR